MSTVLEYNTEKQHFVLTCTIGVPHCFVSASYMRRLKEQELKVKISGKYVNSFRWNYIELHAIICSTIFCFFADTERLDLLPNMGRRRKFQSIVLFMLRYR